MNVRLIILSLILIFLINSLAIIPSSGYHIEVFSHSTIDLSARDVAVSGDGRSIIIGGSHGIAYISIDRHYAEIKWKNHSIRPGIYSDRVISISNDGKLIAVATSKGAILVNDKGQVLWVYKCDAKSVAINSNGSFIATIDNRGVLYLFNNKGILLWKREIFGREGQVVISNNGYVAIGDESGWIYLFDKNGYLLWKYRCNESINSIDMDRSGRYIVACDDTNIYFFDRNGLVWKYKPFLHPIDVDISADGDIVVVGCVRWIYAFDRNGNVLWYSKVKSVVKDVAISTFPKYILAYAGGNVYFFTKSGCYLNMTVASGGYIKDIEISENGRIGVISTEERTYIIYPDEIYESLAFKPPETQVPSELVLFTNPVIKPTWVHELNGNIYFVKASKDGRYILAWVGSMLYTLDQNGAILSVRDICPYSRPYQIAVTPNLEKIIILVGDSVVCLNKNLDVLWKRDLKALWKNWKNYPLSVWMDVWSADISANGDYVVVSSWISVSYEHENLTIFLFSGDGKLLWIKDLGKSKTFANLVAINSDGSIITIGDNGNNRLLIMNNKGNVINEYKIDGNILLMRIYNKYVVVSTSASKVYVINVRSGEIWSCEGTLFSVSPDEKFIVVEFDNKVTLYDINGTKYWSFGRYLKDLLISALSICGDDKYYVVISYSDISTGHSWLCLLNRSGESVAVYREKGKVWPMALSMSIDGRYIAVGIGNKIYFFKVNNVKLKAQKLQEGEISSKKPPTIQLKLLIDKILIDQSTGVQLYCENPVENNKKLNVKINIYIPTNILITGTEGFVYDAVAGVLRGSASIDPGKYLYMYAKIRATKIGTYIIEAEVKYWFEGDKNIKILKYRFPLKVLASATTTPSVVTTMTPVKTATVIEETAPTNGLSGFEAIFAVVSLVVVIYIVKRCH